MHIDPRVLLQYKRSCIDSAILATDLPGAKPTIASRHGRTAEPGPFSPHAPYAGELHGVFQHCKRVPRHMVQSQCKAASKD